MQENLQSVMDACIPAAAEPNWWAMLSIACGIFVVGMCMGALVGVAISHGADRGIRLNDDMYDPRWPG